MTDGVPTEGPEPFSWRFDGFYVALAAVFTLGVLLDGRSHTHGEPEAFVTPEHALFYAAYLGIAALLATHVVARREPGGRWRDAVPPGYGTAPVGLVVFGLAGAGDAVWHTVFGIESNVEALLSPTHLGLFLGGMLFLLGPVLAEWRRPEEASTSASRFAMLASYGMILAGLTFLTLYAHPLVRPFATVERAADHHHGGDPWTLQQLGAAAYLLQSSVLAGALGLVVERWPRSLPRGAFVVVLLPVGVAAALLGSAPAAVPAAIAGALVAEALGATSDLRRNGPFRALVIAVPLALWSVDLAVEALTHGLTWAVHAWTGVVVIGGLAALVTSYLVRPPAGPSVRE